MIESTMDKELKDINKKLGELQKQFTRLERKINKMMIKEDIDNMEDSLKMNKGD